MNIPQPSAILSGLNEPQRAAVSAPQQPLLVLAGAGSGKTRVLVHRIAWLLDVEGLSPLSILAVTFTNKAAAEMRGRIHELLGVPVGGLWVGTFHGLAHRLLRLHWREANLPQTFQILDSEDQIRMIKRILKALDLDEARWPPRQVAGFINARKDEGSRARHLDDRGDEAQQQLIRIYSLYEEQCQRSGVVDFAELLLRSLELLRDNAELQAHYRRRFRHVLVDEFQDTNALQYAWLRLLAGEHSPIFAVGDDDQSIYGWRGAKIENIQNFTRDYETCQVIRLEQNYRSTGTILKAANALIDHNRRRLGKNLWTDSGDGEPIDLYAAFNETDEARYIAGRIRQWTDHGNRRDEVAILYRSNAQSRVFETTFNEQRIPYRVYGGLRFFERAEIKDALAYLRLVTNAADDPSFERIVNHPPRGIGERTVDLVRQQARTESISLWESTLATIEAGELTGRANNALASFMALIRQMAEEIHGLPLAEQVDAVIALANLRGHYKNKEKGESGQARVDNLNELVNAAHSYWQVRDENAPDMDPLSAFLAHAALEAGEGQGEAGEDCVQMMTLHSAKGLEFALVFLAGLEEGLFPHQMSMEEPGRLEEERRLCYVGMTRAEQQLVISYAEQRHLHGQMRFNPPSRFLRELPEVLMNEVRPKVKTYQTSYQTTKPAAAARADSRMTPKVGSRTESGYAIGQRVKHVKFGDGVIVDAEGAGSQARVEVNFAQAGRKWLVLSYANLERL